MKKYIKKTVYLFGLLLTLAFTNSLSVITLYESSSYQSIPPQTDPSDSWGKTN